MLLWWYGRPPPPHSQASKRHQGDNSQLPPFVVIIVAPHPPSLTGFVTRLFLGTYDCSCLPSMPSPSSASKLRIPRRKIWGAESELSRQDPTDFVLLAVQGGLSLVTTSHCIGGRGSSGNLPLVLFLTRLSSLSPPHFDFDRVVLLFRRPPPPSF